MTHRARPLVTRSRSSSHFERPQRAVPIQRRPLVGMVATLVLLILWGGASSAIAQQVSQEFTSETPEGSGRFGETVAQVGDLTGDGVPELLLGAPFETASGTSEAGRVHLYNGADGSRITTLTSTNIETGGHFGSSVAVFKDIDGDTAQDFAVGAPDESSGGRVYVYSGADRSLIQTLSSPNSNPGKFGASMASVGDVTGEGTPDFLVGAPEDGSSNHGRAHLVDGGSVASGSVSFALTFTSPNGESLGAFGGAVSPIRDVTGDETPDVLVGASRETVSGTSGAGRVYILNGSDGSLVETLTSPAPEADGNFGEAVVGTGGVSMGEPPKVVVGAPGESTGGNAYILSGTDGSPLQSLASPNSESNGGFGTSLAGAGDVTADGTADVLIGAPFETVNGTGSVGRVYLLDGADGSPFQIYTPPSIDGQEHFGTGLSAGDLQDTGEFDVLVGAPAEGVSGNTVAGRAYLFTPPPLTLVSTTPGANAVDTPVGTDLSVTFGTPFSRQVPGLEDSVVVRGGQSGNIDGFVSDTTATSLTFTPSTTFAPGERVRMSILKGLRSTQGAPLDTTQTVSFTTAAQSGPATFRVDNVVTTTADGARAVHAADLTGDGDRDLLVASESDETLRWYENDGTGTFTEHVIDTGLQYPRDVTAADMDGSGDQDVVVALGADENNTGSTDAIRWYDNAAGSFDGTFTDVAPSGGDADNPRSIAVGDLTGDGSVDVVGVRKDTAAVRWWENDGSGGFSGSSFIGGANDPRTVALADLNGNGQLDVIWGDVGSDEVNWVPNDGGGTFGSTQTVTATPIRPKDLAVADVDQDGTPDVLVASEGDDTVGWYANDGSGGFSSGGTVTTNADSVQSVHPADLEGNGTLDVLTASAQGDSLSTFMNDGIGNFSFGGTFETNAVGAQDLLAADFDGDGALDPAAASYTNDTVAWYPNVQPPEFSITSTTPSQNAVAVDTSLSEIAVTFSDELDGSTVAAESLAVQGHQSGSISGTVGVSGQTLTFQPSRGFRPGEAVSVSIAAGIASTGGEALDTTQTFGFTAQTTPGPGTFPKVDVNLTAVGDGSAEWGDYDGDGDLDLVVVGDQGDFTGMATIYENDVENGNGFIPLNAGLTGVYYAAAKWGDYDGDGDLDLIVTGDDGSGPTATIYENDVANGAGFTSLNAGLTGVDRGAVDWGDYDGDGDLDLVVTGDDGTVHTTTIYENDVENGNGFSPIGAGLEGVYRGDVEWGDYDGDGDLDLVVTGNASIGENRATIYENDVANGNGFNPIGAGLTGVREGSAAWGDYDNDGDLDLVVTGSENPDGTSIVTSIYENEGAGSFSPLNAGLPKVWRTGNVEWGDYDGDGDLDLVLTGEFEGEDTAAIYENDVENGTGFSPLNAGLTAVNQGDVGWGDYDGDGDLDLIVTGFDTDANETVYLSKQGVPLQPTVANPSRNAIGVELSIAEIGIAFSAPLDASTVTDGDTEMQVVGRQSGRISGAIEVDGTEDHELQFRPSQNFRAGEQVTVSVYADSLAAADGTLLGRSGTFQFTAQNTSGPVAFPVRDSLGTAGAADVRPVDINGDDSLDVVVALRDSALVWHDGANAFAESVIATSNAGFEAAATADVDGDGALDVVTDEMAWYQNDGAGSFSDAHSIGDAAGDVTAADFTGDGRPDLLADVSAEQAIVWYENDPGSFSGFSLADTIATGVSSSDLATADVNGDGTLDAVVASSGANKIVWYENTDGADRFSDERLIADGPSTTAISVADMNRDGALDVVAANGSNIAWYENTDGAGTFSTASTVTAGPSDPRDVTAADVNADGALDVVATLYADGTVAWYENTDGGDSFSSARAVTTDADGAETVSVVDLDGDGDLDPLYASEDAGVTAWYPNTTLTGNNNAPVARADTASVLEDSTTTVEVLANDADLDGALDTSSVAVVEEPSNGSASVQPDGAITYTPNEDYSGPDELAYSVADRAEEVKRDTAAVVLDVLEVTLTATQDTFRVGSAQVGQPGDTARVSIENAGSVSVTGLQASIEGDAADEFQLVEDLGDEQIEPGRADTVEVAFAPTTTGGREVRLEVQSSEGGVAQPAVRGRGVSLAVEAGVPSRGEAVSMDLVVEGGFVPKTRSELHVREGGTEGYRKLSLSEVDTEEETRQLSAQVPDSLVTSRGLDYYVVLSHEEDLLTVPAGGEEQARARPRHLPVQFTEWEAPVEMESEQYRMVSVPARAEIDASLEASYGAYDPESWRVLHWNSDAEGYREYPEIDSLGPGMGMWLITSDGAPFSIDEGQTVEADTPYEIELAPGWNQIGVPFGFGVPWAAVLDSSEAGPETLDGPVAYSDSTYQYGQSVLEPWEGYFVYNAASEPSTLVVPPVGAGTAASRGKIAARGGDGPKALAGIEELGPSAERPSLSPEKPAPEEQEEGTRRPAVRESDGEPSDPGRPALDRPRGKASPAAGSQASDKAAGNASEEADGDTPYTLELEVEAERTRRVWLGLRPEAQDGRDAFDFAQAPPIEQGMQASLLETEDGEGQNASKKEGARYAGSFKPGEGDGQSWVLLVENRSSGTFRRRETVQVRLREVGSLPDNFARYVFDLKRERPLADDLATLELGAGEQRRFKVVVGTDDYAKQESNGIPLRSYEDELRGNYPNPFVQGTTVEYTLSEKREVTIEIYNILGQRVRRLVRGEQKEAGLHSVRWNGRNDLGRPVGSGMYFYRIDAGDFTEVRKMVRIR